MNDLSREQEILLREYKEAGETCRNHEKLIRTGLTIFVAIQAAIIGFIGKSTNSSPLNIFLLEILGLWMSVVVLITTLRLHHRYKNYIERAKWIEQRLGMYFYQYSFDYFKNKPIPGQCLGNQKLWASIPLLSFFLYAILIVRDGNKLVESLLLRYFMP